MINFASTFSARNTAEEEVKRANAAALPGHRGRCMGALILALASSTACDDAELTGVEVIVRYAPELGLDQVALSGQLDDGSEAFPSGRAPDPPRALVDGEDTVVLLLPETLVDRSIELLVEGMSNGTIVAEGRSTVAIASKKIVVSVIELAELVEVECGDRVLSASEACDDGNRNGGDGCSGVCQIESGWACQSIPSECTLLDAGVDGGFEDLGVDGGEEVIDAGDAGEAEVGTPDAEDADVDPEPDAEVDTGEPPCIPEPLSIADGVDQDCDGFDECYQDLDGDEFGSSMVVSDDDLVCTNPSSPTSAVATDCDDGDALVFPGTTCDDGSATSANDLCLGPACRGYETSGCGANCAACGTGACCSRDCPAGNCPSCASDCSCDLTCNGEMTCNATCETGAICHLFVNSGNNATLTCNDGASCDFECNSTATCHLECIGSAFCIISYCNGSSCTLGCTGAAMSCPGGVQTCNRACP